ncbi:male-specific lethal 1 homolog isoform X2 [Homarus americanus]|uniref:male-specific lethal 1 homolog isoform X2 n=1 Tax=Homarus americanus TaxID=6706 RepID=UPI001C4545C1|nr:male-specific lethal 1 homolog isoform X2 [Homarus americanus]
MPRTVALYNGDNNAIGIEDCVVAVGRIDGVTAVRGGGRPRDKVVTSSMTTSEANDNKLAMAVEFDHMYTGCSDSKASIGKDIEVQHLKDLLLLHLDLIQQQSEQLVAKDKQIKTLRDENENLRAKLERMDRRVCLSLHKRPSEASTNTENVVEKIPEVTSVKQTKSEFPSDKPDSTEAPLNKTPPSSITSKTGSPTIKTLSLSNKPGSPPSSRTGFPGNKTGLLCNKPVSPSNKVVSPITTKNASPPCTKVGSPPSKLGSPSSKTGTHSTKICFPVSKAGPPGTKATSPCRITESNGSKADSASEKAGSPGKPGSPSNKLVSSKPVSPCSKPLSPSSKTVPLPSKATSPSNKVASPPSKPGSPSSKIGAPPSNKTVSQPSKATSPPSKAVSPPSKAVSPPSKAPSPPSKAISPPSKAVSPPSKAVSPSSKTTSPPNKATSPPSKATSPPSKATSPPSKATSPLSKATSPPSKATSPPSKAISPPSKATSPPSKATFPPSKAISPTKATSPPSKVIISPPSKVITSPLSKVISLPSKAASPPSKVTSPPSKPISPPLKTSSPPHKGGLSPKSTRIELTRRPSPKAITPKTSPRERCTRRETTESLLSENESDIESVLDPSRKETSKIAERRDSRQAVKRRSESENELPTKKIKSDDLNDSSGATDHNLRSRDKSNQKIKDTIKQSSPVPAVERPATPTSRAAALEAKKLRQKLLLKGQPPAGRPVRGEGILNTSVSYYLPYGILVQDPNPEEECLQAQVEIPRWGTRILTSLYVMEGTENLEDEVFLKRHAKPEQDEKRRKRWDLQRMREQRHYERLRERYEGRQNPSEPEVSGYRTLWPNPESAVYLHVDDCLPVCAFGQPMARIPPQEFLLPWLSGRCQDGVSTRRRKRP